MASGCVRTTRKLRQWMIEQVDCGKYQGLTWDDPDKASFRIPWKHAGKQDFRHDEDAAIFKAWAIYKNKYKAGDKNEAAMWKTRLRCALNKSPEFAEVPERSQLDISEPYKVYRLVPLDEQRVNASSGRGGIKRKLKEKSGDLSSEDEMEAKRPATSNLISMEVKQECPSGVSSSYIEDSGLGSSADSPQSLLDSPPRNSDSPQSLLDSPQRNSDSPQSLLDSPPRSVDSLKEITLTMELAPDISAELQADIYAMQVTIYYGEQEVCRKDILSSDCKISSVPPAVPARRSLPGSTMERIILPSTDIIADPTRRRSTTELLTYLEKGVMLVSIPRGIYAQRFCQGRVFWTGLCAPNRGQSNKLEREAYTQLFDTSQFLQELDIFQKHHGPAPDHRVMLCFGEEITDANQNSGKLITVQVEQHLARQLQDGAEIHGPLLTQLEQHLAGQLQDGAETQGPSLTQVEQNLAQNLQNEAETYSTSVAQVQQNLAQQLQDQAETYNASLSLLVDPSSSIFTLQDMEEPSLLNLG